VRFRYTQEHDELRSSVRRLLDEAVGAASPNGGPDDTLTTRLADEIGAFSIAVPERFGGAGFGLVELGVVCHELGRAAANLPLFSATLASQLLLASGDDAACAERLPALATARSRAAAAVIEAGGGWGDRPAATASEFDGEWRLSGAKTWVLDGLAADWFVVAASTRRGVSLFLVDADAGGVAVADTPTVDLSRSVARAHFTDAPARLLGVDGAGEQPLRLVSNRALALVAADNTGIAERCLAMATSWASEREQFGRPIGSFQAIKHKLADVQLELEAAVSASMFALWTADDQPDELAHVARIAAVTCADAAQLATQENIQVHGGIGATWEHPAHRYLRRARLNRVLFGDPQELLADLAQHIENEHSNA